MKKIYLKLTPRQKERGVVFSSCLSVYKIETKNDTIHEVLNTDKDKNEKIARLKDDRFFNKSHFKFNIIRS